MMTLIDKLPLETLRELFDDTFGPTCSRKQLQAITGYQNAPEQIRWLRDHKWVFETDCRGRPVVGRYYADLRLAGVDPATRRPAPPSTLTVGPKLDRVA